MTHLCSKVSPLQNGSPPNVVSSVWDTPTRLNRLQRIRLAFLCTLLSKISVEQFGQFGGPFKSPFHRVVRLVSLGGYLRSFSSLVFGWGSRGAFWVVVVYLGCCWLAVAVWANGVQSGGFWFEVCIPRVCCVFVTSGQRRPSSSFLADSPWEIRRWR